MPRAERTAHPGAFPPFALLGTRSSSFACYKAPLSDFVYFVVSLESNSSVEFSDHSYSCAEFAAHVGAG